MYGAVNKLKIDFHKVFTLSYIQLQEMEGKTLNVMFKNTKMKSEKLSYLEQSIGPVVFK